MRSSSPPSVPAASCPILAFGQEPLCYGLHSRVTLRGWAAGDLAPGCNAVFGRQQKEGQESLIRNSQLGPSHCDGLVERNPTYGFLSNFAGRKVALRPLDLNLRRPIRRYRPKTLHLSRYGKSQSSCRR